MADTTNIHSIILTQIEKPRILDQSEVNGVHSQTIKLTNARGHETNINLFYPSAEQAEIQGIPTADEVQARVTAASTQGIVETRKLATSQKYQDAIGRVAVTLKSSDTVEWLDSGNGDDGDAAPFGNYAATFCDLASSHYDDTIRRAEITRRSIRACLDELEKWEDANSAEISLANALIQAFNLFDYPADSHRFDNAFTAFWEGYGWASGLVRAARA